MRVVVPAALNCTSHPIWRGYLFLVEGSLRDGTFPFEPVRSSLEVLHNFGVAETSEALANSLAVEANADGVGVGVLAANAWARSPSRNSIGPPCFPAFLTALIVAAANTLAASQRRHLLETAEELLFFGSTDVLRSTPWPARRTTVLTNLLAGDQSMDVGSRPWLDVPTPIAVSPCQDPFVSRLREVPFPTARKTALRIWFTDQHSVLSGELVSILPRALRAAGIKVTFDKQSVSFYCKHHGVCFSDGRVGRLLRVPHIYEVEPQAGMLDGFVQVQRVSRDIGRISREFARLFRQRLRSVDAFLCTIPIAWCRLYDGFRGAKPLIGVMDQPLFLFVPVEIRIDWWLRFSDLVRNPRNLFVCHTVFLREQLVWQVGVRIPVVRYLASRTAQWRWRGDEPNNPASWRVLVVSMQQYRPQFLRILRQIQDLNPALAKLACVGLEDVPAWRDNKPDRYEKLAEHRAAAVFPYDVHFVKLLELYSMGIPLWLPEDFYMWAFSWTIADPSVLEDGMADQLGRQRLSWTHPHPPYCARRGRLQFDPVACAYWASYSDISRLPHVRYFASLPDLLAQLRDTNLGTLRVASRDMRAFQSTTTAQAVVFWRRAIAAMLIGNTSGLEVG